MEFLGYEAAVAAGVDLWAWETGVYPKWFRAKVIAWYNLHKAVIIHSESAAAEKAKSKK